MIRLRRTLAVDALATALIGLLLLFFPRQIVDATDIPDPDPAIYANLAGAALLGLAIALTRAVEAPVLSRAVIEASVVVKAVWVVVVALWATVLDTGTGTTGTAVLAAVAGAFLILAVLEADGLRRLIP